MDVIRRMGTVGISQDHTDRTLEQIRRLADTHKYGVAYGQSVFCKSTGLWLPITKVSQIYVCS